MTMHVSTEAACSHCSTYSDDVIVTSSPVPVTSSTVDDVDTALSYVYLSLTTVTSLLSIVGCVLLIVADVAFRDLRCAGRRLLTWLSVADCLTAIGNMLGVTWWYARPSYDSGVEYVAWCQLHSSLTIFSSISSFLWTVAVALNVYLCVVRNATTLARRLAVWYHIVCWTLPGIVAVTALSLGVLGHEEHLHSPSWCWIDPDVRLLSLLWWQYFTGKAWEIVCYFVIIGLYVPAKCKIRKQMQRLERDSSSGSSGHRRRGCNEDAIADANRKLILVPLVFIVLRIWGTLRFVINSHFVSDVETNYMAWIIPLQGVGDSAQGFANCVLFVFLVRSVRHRYQRAVCSCCRRRRHLTITDSEQLAPVQRLDNAAGDDCSHAHYCNSNIPSTVSPVVVSADSLQL